MIPLFQQGAFTATANDTPETIAQKRAYIAAMMPRFGSAKYVGEGLGQLATGVLVGRKNKQLDAAEGAGRKSAEEMFGRLFGTANSAQSPAVQGPLSVLGPTPVDPSSPEAIADDTMAALGKGPGGVDFAALEQQYGLPPGYLHRTGQIESNLDPNAKNPNSTAAGLFQFIDSTAADYGLTNKFDPLASSDAAARLAADNAAHLRSVLGREPTAAELYLAHQQGAGGAANLLRDPNARAVDVVGADAIRLNGGRMDMTAGEFANLWLSKFGDAKAPVGGGPAPTSAPQIPINELYMALQNPWLSAEQKGLISSMIQEQQQASDPLRQLELRKAELELAQLETPTQQAPEEFTTRMFMLNSLGIDPQSEEGQTYMLTGNLPEAPKPGYTRLTPEQVATMPGLDPSKAYQVSPEGKIEVIGGGGTTINNNMGSAVEPLGTEGQILVPDATHPSGFRVEIAPGSKLDQERIAAEKAGTNAAGIAETTGDTIVTAAIRARDANNDRVLGGVLGALAAYNPSSPNAEVYRQTEALKSIASIENITAMRRASPTGAALGAASDKDIELLKNKHGALDPASPNYERDLLDYTRALLRTVHGVEAGDAIFEQTFQGVAAPAPDADAELMRKYGIEP